MGTGLVAEDFGEFEEERGDRRRKRGGGHGIC
jgi:hypothetical protein